MSTSPVVSNIASGAYTGSYDGEAIGDVEGVWQINTSSYGKPVRASQWGDMVVDSIHAGINQYIIVNLKEWTDETKAIFWPWDTVFGESGTPGVLLSSLAKQLILTAVPGTPAATEGPATITFPKAIYSPGHSMTWPFGVGERNISIVLMCIPCIPDPADQSLSFFTFT